MKVIILRCIWKNTLELARKFCKIKNNKIFPIRYDLIIKPLYLKQHVRAQEYTKVLAEYDRKSRNSSKHILKHNTSFIITYMKNWNGGLVS